VRSPATFRLTVWISDAVIAAEVLLWQLLGYRDIVLIADSALGAIWGLNINTGGSGIAIQNSDLAPTSSFPLGINGLHVRGPTLYFTNSA
jgi:hypothetical protein